MSYCVQCGVKLAEYNEKCPLCETVVNNPNTEPSKINNHYPNYQVVEMSEKKRVNRYVVGLILSLQAVVYSVIVGMIDWLTSDQVGWSYIPILSLALLWFTVAYPFFRRRSSFFRLFTYDSAAVSVYLLALNYILASNFMWSKFACVGILMVWVIVAGVFITERIRRALPLTIFYIISSIILTFIMLSFFRHEANIFEIGIPIASVFFVLGMVSYFLIKSSRGGVVGMIMVLLINVSFLAIAIDLITSYYASGALSVSWSMIILVVTVPAITTMFAVKKVTELKAYISRKMHS